MRPSADDVREIAQSVSRSALLAVPRGLSTPPTGYEEISTTSRYQVDGTRYRSRSDRHGDLICGTDGVSVATPRGPTTVAYDSCAALLRWPDGGRLLVGTDGISVQIEPTLVAISDAALAGIDQAVPAGVAIDLPARPPSSIPKPSRGDGLRNRTTALRPRRARFEQYFGIRGGIFGYLFVFSLIAGMLACVVYALFFG